MAAERPRELAAARRRETDRTLGGFALDHPTRRSLPILAGPSTELQLNTVRPPLRPIACWSLGDVRFELDSSFLQPEVAAETAILASLVRRHARRGAPPVASVFGHADPTGNDEHNKQLAGRRAAAVYGLLTRDVALWERLFSRPFGADDWSPHLGAMLAALDRDRNNRLLDASSRAELFAAYMDAVCADQAKQSFRLDPRDFLARGEDPSGKGDYQGCGEWNPALLLSTSDLATLLKPKRDQLNTPNRRVVLFLFPPGTHAPPSRWPCPTAAEDTTGCRRRLFTDGETRRTPGPVAREYKSTRDTFACRFYDRLARQSPCEGLLHERIVEIIFDDAVHGLREGVLVSMAFADGSSEKRPTDSEGAVFVEASKGPWVDCTYTAVWDMPLRRVFLEPPDPATPEGAWQRLSNLGFLRGNELPPLSPPTPEALLQGLLRFQPHFGIEATGLLDAATANALKAQHDEASEPWRNRGFAGPAPEAPEGAPEPKART